MNKTYIPKSVINKKLCRDCKHVVVTYPNLIHPHYMCGLSRNNVDDSPIHDAHFARKLSIICGGEKWELKDNIVVCDSEEETSSREKEDNILRYMDTAQDIVQQKITGYVTNGYLDEAIKRVKNEK